MYFIDSYSWYNPVTIAALLDKRERHLAFLFSAKKYSYSGDYSFIAWGASKEIYDLEGLAANISYNKNFYDNFLVGYLGYETLSTNTHNVSQDLQEKLLNFPEIYFFKPQNLLVFDHHKQKVSFFSQHKSSNIDELLKDSAQQGEELYSAHDNNLAVQHISSNMTKKSYLDNVLAIKNHIRAGDYYLANLTRKFYGKIEVKQSFSIFKNLINNTPTPYLSYVKFNEKHILSSSPERFIKIDDRGNINSRPIKGTINNDVNNGENNIEKLRSSEKNKAENLMIVDLMRHDLGLSAKKSSVYVDQLFNIDSFATLHHMSSSINAAKQNNISNLQVILNAFPPGSMTGTPKIAAINALKKLELLNRGVYSGALGYFAGDGSCDLSVVIRTLLLENNKFEFQVGGAIIYDSDPEDEWQETIVKSKGICKALNIDVKMLETL